MVLPTLLVLENPPLVLTEPPMTTPPPDLAAVLDPDSVAAMTRLLTNGAWWYWECERSPHAMDDAKAVVVAVRALAARVAEVERQLVSMTADRDACVIVLERVKGERDAERERADRLEDPDFPSGSLVKILPGKVDHFVGEIGRVVGPPRGEIVVTFGKDGFWTYRRGQLQMQMMTAAGPAPDAKGGTPA